MKPGNRLIQTVRYLLASLVIAVGLVTIIGSEMRITGEGGPMAAGSGAGGLRRHPDPGGLEGHQEAGVERLPSLASGLPLGSPHLRTGHPLGPSEGSLRSRPRAATEADDS